MAEEQVSQQDIINSLNARLRLAEERQTEIRRKMALVEQNMLSGTKRLNQEMRLMKDDISAIKQTLRNIEERIITIIKELQLTPKKEDVEVVKKYVDYWNPVKFVSIDKIDEIVKDSLKQLKEENAE
ncbi:hypothetical protein HY486_02160 [Candidatus Woesearchaeota archaeon]|nr:hypothetical protein [Candidatus Woesearchaeota archaeon]